MGELFAQLKPTTQEIRQYVLHGALATLLVLFIMMGYELDFSDMQALGLLSAKLSYMSSGSHLAGYGIFAVKLFPLFVLIFFLAEKGLDLLRKSNEDDDD